MCERKTLSDNNFRATPHICIEMYKKEEEQGKSPIFSLFIMENEGVAWHGGSSSCLRALLFESMS